MMILAELLIEVLLQRNVGHVFGVPGDFVLSFYKALEDSDLEIINTCDEQGAGFAADAYARMHGLSCLCVTYGVGAYKVVNAIAEAYAEKSPVVLISGAPGLFEREQCEMIHHKSVAYDTQFKIFSELTCYSAVLDNPETNAQAILSAIYHAMLYKRPVYLECPRDMFLSKIKRPGSMTFKRPKSKTVSLLAAKKALYRRLDSAKKSAILLGTDIQRYSFQDQVLAFATRLGLPIFSTIMAKSVISEQHPLFCGVYQGHLADEEIADDLESCDCILSLGAWMSDVNLGIYSSKLNQKQLVEFNSDSLVIDGHCYDTVLLEDSLSLLSDYQPKTPVFESSFSKPLTSRGFVAEEGVEMTTQRLFACLSQFIDGNYCVLCDVGDVLFSSLSMPMPERSQFLSPAYYTSMGFAVPAALAAGALYPNKRLLVLVGDGAFQMTGMELSTLQRFGMAPIVVVLNNQGYGTERPIQDGKFNDILNWDYHRLPELLGCGQGFLVKDEARLVHALAMADISTDSFTILNVSVPKHDHSPLLKQLAAGLHDQL
ncbi:MAG: thiamine pyrophosphate-binding protein [bacterium]